MQDKPWRSEELRKGEDAPPRLNEGGLEKVSRLYKAKTGVGCDGFHFKIPLDLTNETRGENVDFLEKVEQSGKWPQQACTTMFSLIPKNVTSERPIALVPTLICWWEVLRASEVAKWQHKCRIDWDAPDGRNGGAQRTVWEILMEEQQQKNKELCPWSWTWQRHSSESASLWSGLGRRTSASQERSCGCFVGTSSTRGECSLKNVWQSRSQSSRLSC